MQELSNGTNFTTPFHVNRYVTPRKPVSVDPLVTLAGGQPAEGRHFQDAQHSKTILHLMCGHLLVTALPTSCRAHFQTACLRSSS